MGAVDNTVIDFSAFARKAAAARNPNPRRMIRAGMQLVEGAIRIRSDEERPITTPAEAVGAWVNSLAKEVDDDGEFHRIAELREAIVSAAEEVENAAKAGAPKAERLKRALFQDALGVIGAQDYRPALQVLPWILTGVFGGMLLGMFFASRRRR